MGNELPEAISSDTILGKAKVKKLRGCILAKLLDLLAQIGSTNKSNNNLLLQLQKKIDHLFGGSLPYLGMCISWLFIYLAGKAESAVHIEQADGGRILAGGPVSRIVGVGDCHDIIRSVQSPSAI